MADTPEDRKFSPMEKALPNIPNLDVDKDDAAPGVEVSIDQPSTDPTQPAITELADGGAEVNFDPNQVAPQDPNDHFANSAELLPDNVLGPLASNKKEKHMDYKMSRKEWESTYTQGLDLLGFKYENKSEPFQGASGATHPVLAEAVTQFQALAYKELLPATGPVRTQILGINTPEKVQQANRVKEFMNFQIMDQMREYS
jgi:hypothetical protein